MDDDDIDDLERRLIVARDRVALGVTKTDKERNQFMVLLNELVADAKLLRAYSIIPNPDGSVKIKNPNVFLQVLRLRRELLDTMLSAMREVFDMQRQQNFYDAVMDEADLEAPGIRDRIMDRFARLLHEDKAPEMRLLK